MSARRAWLLIRGLVREKRHWEDFPSLLQTQFPDDRLVLYDCAGNGQRNTEKSATTIQAMVDDLRAFLVRESVDSPVTIIALSLGAMVAVEFMDKYPDESTGAILISTSLRGLNPFYQRLLPTSYPAILRALIFAGKTRKKELSNLNLVSNIVANNANARDSIIKHWVSYANQNPVSGLNGLRQLRAAMRFRVPLQAPQRPVFVLASSADHLVSPECSRTLARHWHVPIATHDTAGHDIPLDDGNWVCEKIALWLNP